MASVLLSTVGQAVGGPLGAGIGAAVGASLDAARASRRGDADDIYQLQSAYGAFVPRIFGTMRASGHLIWALSPVAGDGRKGDGRREADASFAIAISTGPILAIRRIWADGREIRNADGQFAFDVEMRLHSFPVKWPDPLIAAAEGAGGTPSFRGLSHIVFEGFPLGPFGNRIPSLSFEAVADEDGADSWLRTLASEAGIGTGLIHAAPDVAGSLCFSGRLSADIDRIARICGTAIGQIDGRVVAGETAVSHTVPDDGTVPGQQAGERASMEIADPPRGLSLTHIDPDREFQRGLQRIERDRPGRQIQLSWSVSANAGVAAQLGRQLLRSEEARSDRLSLTLPHRWLHICIGDRIFLRGAESWRVVRKQIQGLLVSIDAEKMPGETNLRVGPKDSGRSLSHPMRAAGPTRMQVFEPPVCMRAGGAGLFVVGGGGSDWRGAEVTVLQAGEETLLGTLPAARGFGRLLAPLPRGPDTIWDERHEILMQWEGHDGLLSRDESAILAGSGTLLVGNELVQAREVERLGEGVVRLSGLLRNRFLTQAPAAGWQAGTQVFELGAAGQAEMPVRGDMIDRDIVVLAKGRGDQPGGTELFHRIEGVGIAPLSPVHLRTEWLADGGLCLSWIARSRSAWHWHDGEPAADAAYRVRCRRADGSIFETRVSEPFLHLTSMEQIEAFGGGQSQADFQVEVLGDGPGWIRCSDWVRLSVGGH